MTRYPFHSEPASAPSSVAARRENSPKPIAANKRTAPASLVPGADLASGRIISGSLERAEREGNKKTKKAADYDFRRVVAMHFFYGAVREAVARVELLAEEVECLGLEAGCPAHSQSRRE